MATHRPTRLHEEGPTSPARPADASASAAPAATADAPKPQDNGTFHIKLPILLPQGIDIVIPRLPFQDEVSA